MQRLFDIILSIFALLILLPVFTLVIIVLSFTGEREIFYRQSRIGLGGKEFQLIKFVTMLRDSPSLGTGTITIQNDPRVLPFGRFLRKSKINELPQLINILIGDMSVIGPRPLTHETFSAYPTSTQKIIMSIPPGLSGIGSIIFRNEEEYLSGADDAKFVYKNKIAPIKGELECWYVNNRTMKNYFILIFCTVVEVVIPRLSLSSKIFRNLPVLDKS